MAGFAVLKSCSALFAENFPILGGSFGPRENVIVQTAAMAAGGLSNVFVSAYPALYQLGLLESPEKDFWRIVALTAVGGYFGFFFATPRKYWQPGKGFVRADMWCSEEIFHYLCCARAAACFPVGVGHGAHDTVYARCYKG